MGVDFRAMISKLEYTITMAMTIIIIITTIIFPRYRHGVLPPSRRAHLRNESPLVAGGLEVVEPSHLAAHRHLRHEILCARF